MRVLRDSNEEGSFTFIIGAFCKLGNSADACLVRRARGQPS